jgi:hypothetical protein
MIQRYSKENENTMLCHYHQLRECDKRHYAGVGVLKLGFGGKKYICELFRMSPNTLRKGILGSNSETTFLAAGHQRKVGGAQAFFCPPRS